MNSSLQKFKAWRVQRKKRAKERSLRKWEQIRADGKRRFVRRTALAYGLTVVGATDVYERLFHGESESFLPLKLFFFVLVGVFIASEAWTNREAKYQKALHEAGMGVLPESKTSP